MRDALWRYTDNAYIQEILSQLKKLLYVPSEDTLVNRFKKSTSSQVIDVLKNLVKHFPYLVVFDGYAGVELHIVGNRTRDLSEFWEAYRRETEDMFKISN